MPSLFGLLKLYPTLTILSAAHLAENGCAQLACRAYMATRGSRLLATAFCATPDTARSGIAAAAL